MSNNSSEQQSASIKRKLDFEDITLAMGVMSLDELNLDNHNINNNDKIIEQVKARLEEQNSFGHVHKKGIIDRLHPIPMTDYVHIPGYFSFAIHYTPDIAIQDFFASYENDPDLHDPILGLHDAFQRFAVRTSLTSSIEIMGYNSTFSPDVNSRLKFSSDRHTWTYSVGFQGLKNPVDYFFSHARSCLDSIDSLGEMNNELIVPMLCLHFMKLKERFNRHDVATILDFFESSALNKEVISSTANDLYNFAVLDDNVKSIDNRINRIVTELRLLKEDCDCHVSRAVAKYIKDTKKQSHERYKAQYPTIQIPVVDPPEEEITLEFEEEENPYQRFDEEMERKYGYYEEDTIIDPEELEMEDQEA